MADVLMHNLRNKKVIVVTNCLGCPLSALEFSEAYCTGIDKKKHLYIGLTVQVAAESIPDWCPLPNQAFIKDA